MSDRTRGYLIVLTCIMSSMALAMSSTIINVAVPDIMGAFGIGQDLAQWMATAFFAAMSSGLLASSWAIRSFGERRVFVCMMALFITASIIGGSGQDFNSIILSRMAQGFSAGISLPLTQLAMYRVFGPDKRSLANGLFGFSFVLGPGIGPWIGGMAVDAFDWRSVFYVAPPIAAITALLASYVLSPREEMGPKPKFDILGFGLLSVFLVCILSALSDGQRLGWQSDQVVFLMSAGIFLAIGFIFWEWKNENRLLDVRRFSSPQFAAANVISFLFGIGLFGSLYLLPIFVQIVQNYTPTRAGLVLIPAGLILGIVMPVMGRIGDRIPAHMPIIIGTLGFVLSCYALGIADANTGFWAFALIVMFGRGAHSAIFPQLMAAGLKNIPVKEIPAANGTINFTRQLGGAFGINLLAIYLERKISFFSEHISTTQSPAHSASKEFLYKVTDIFSFAGLSDSVSQPAAIIYLNQTFVAQANMLAFRETFIMLGIVSGIGVIFAFILKPPSNKS